ncbi:MAG: ATP-binding cassette domain-containing protein, partial [Bacteroidota bacterium]
TSPDVVPAVAEFMPSRWIYEGLMVHQYKHNNYRKNLFDIEMKESQADFKQVYYIPELRDIISATVDYTNDEGNLSQEEYHNNIELIRNEIALEMKRVPDIDFDGLDKVTPEKFSGEVAREINAYLDRLLKHYQQEFSKANSRKERIISANIDANKEKYEQIRNDYSNTSIEDIVRKTFDKNKILRKDDRLIQMVDPIYQKPEPSNFFDFRTHFFAPSKHFAGHYFETLWFNISVVWVLTILLYVVLYFDLLRKALNFAGNINFSRMLKKKDN